MLSTLTPLSTTPPTPWKNGGGTTRELLATPHFRISVAEVTQDGAFSVFANTQRWFAVLEGAGVRLNIDGQTHTQTLTTAPLCFDGAANTTCELIDGATQDLNLMLFKGARGRMRLVSAATSMQAEMTLEADTHLAVYAQSACTLHIDGLARHIPLQALFHMALQRTSLVICESEHALLMEIYE